MNHGSYIRILPRVLGGQLVQLDEFYCLVRLLGRYSGKIRLDIIVQQQYRLYVNNFHNRDWRREQK